VTTAVAPHHDSGPEGPEWLALLRPWTLPTDAAALDERILTGIPLSLPVRPDPASVVLADDVDVPGPLGRDDRPHPEGER
jgi:hypothetical protein